MERLASGALTPPSFAPYFLLSEKSIAIYLSFSFSPAVLDRETQSLHPTFVEYIDGARIYLENETDKEAPAVRDIKLHFCNFIRKMIKSFSRKRFYSDYSDYVILEVD